MKETTGQLDVLLYPVHFFFEINTGSKDASPFLTSTTFREAPQYTLQPTVVATAPQRATRTSKSRVKRRGRRYRAALGDTKLQASYNDNTVLFHVRWNEEGWRVAYTTDGNDYHEEIGGIVYNDGRDAMLTEFYPDDVPATKIATKDLVLMLEAAMHYVHVNIANKNHEMTIRLMDALTYPSNPNVSLRAVCEMLGTESFWKKCNYSLSYIPPPAPHGSTEVVGAGLLMAMANGNADTLACMSEEYMQNIYGTDIVEVSRTISEGDKVFTVSVDHTHTNP